ncbi:MAG: hypothetical protein WBV85_00090 [Solirubrobacteraceae bacterium]
MLAILALAAVALAVSGCGKSSKAESTSTSAENTPTTQATTTQATTSTTPAATKTTSTGEVKLKAGAPLSRAVWIAKGDAICARANIARHAQAAKTEAQIVRLIPQVAAHDHLEAVELSKLVPPANRQSDWKILVGDAQKTSEYAIQLGEYAEAKRYDEAQPLFAAAAKVQEQIEAIGRRDGFKKCSVQ